ncbi:HSP20-like chaperone [Geopyxis carbonaria]|nr:HSP20-like chaperone [Geopyxis carbonaria]
MTSYCVRPGSSATRNTSHQQQPQTLESLLSSLGLSPAAVSSPNHAGQSKPNPTPRNPTRAVRSFQPNFDVAETAEAYFLDGDLPGLSDKRAVVIEFADDRTLLIRGRVERTQPRADKGKQIETSKPEEKRKSYNPYTWLSERTFGTFQRTFSFPTPVELEKVTASLENGVLTVVVPKKIWKGARRVQVE